MIEKKSSKKLLFSKLFDNSTKAQISWNLIIHKELSGVQLTRILQKNISTITRNLKLMEEENLVFLSRTEMKKNFQEKYWKLNPEILKEQLIQQNNHKLSPVQLENTINLTQGIIGSLLENAKNKPNSQIELLMLLLNKETAKLLDDQLSQLLIKFMEEHQSEMISNLEQINTNNTLFFFITSSVKNIIRK